ncbi:protein disulfide oxidoreductase [Shewanella colwelliana]|uniref:protein disulfide oxidoreductase n=1 Tax=Shewanella colwelliana TaxID=23 RepID=UPI0004AE8F9F|nr:protein disulfide oxidoreductase [Shewanella colwelliana]
MKLYQRVKAIHQALTPQSSWLKGLRDLAIFGLILFAVLSYQQRNMAREQAPDIMALTTQNTVVSMAKDAPTLVYFWGSWCPVCRITSPMVNAINDDYAVITVAVASGGNDDINQYLTEHDYQFPVINDTEGMHIQWGALAYPAIYVVDQTGQIRYVTSGVTTTWGLRARLWLATNL